MLLILHRYILRQLLATVLLSWTAMTLLVTLGGGVANLFRGEGLGAVELAAIFILMAPAAATFVFPVAAIFGAAITYGRMSADNELVACRAAGMNVHRLLWPAAILGAVVGCTMYYSWNYWIPRFAQRVEKMTQLDLARLAASQLQKHRTLSAKNYRLHADKVDAVPPDPNLPNVTTLKLVGVSFVELGGRDPVTFGTARDARISVTRDDAGASEVVADMSGVRYFNLSQNAYGGLEEQRIGPVKIQLPIKIRLSFQDLDALRVFERDPTQMSDVADQLLGLRRGMLYMMSFNSVIDSLTAGKQCVFATGDGSVVIDGVESILRSAKYGDLELKKPAVTVSGTRPMHLRAETGRLKIVDTATNRDAAALELELVNVEQSDKPFDDRRAKIVRKGRISFRPLDITAEVRAAAASWTDADILNPSRTPALSEEMQGFRQKLITRVGLKLSQIRCLIDFRAATSVCCVALAVLAAMLGIYFRGAQVLTAFGVSCVPGLFVFLAIMAGRNVGAVPENTQLGLAMMWGVNLLLVLVTVVVGARAVQR